MTDKIEWGAEDLQAAIAEAIDDSLDCDWTGSVGARSVMELPVIAEAPAMVRALREAIDQILTFANARGSECECSDDELVGEYRAILARIEGEPK